MQAKGAVTALLFAALATTGCRCDPAGRSDAGEGPEDAGSCEPPVSAEPCLKGVCDADGTARLAPVADGTAVAEQAAGDCKRRVCVGGAVTAVADDTDLPDDARECTANACLAGAPSNPPLAAGTACGTGGTCDGNGQCVQCTRASQCPGADTECRVRVCAAGACGFSNAPPGTVVAAQTAGDCRRVQCAGDGTTVTVYDDADLNDDGNACTLDSCDAGTPVRIAAPINTPCGTNLRCNPSGTCVGCNQPSDCGTPARCKANTCVGGVCGVGNAPDTTACDDGNLCTATDQCVAGACVGANPVVCTALSQCHLAGVCQPDAGACTNPPADAGTPCSLDGGNQCNGSGACSVTLPFVTGTSPAEASVAQPSATPVTVGFSEAMLPASLVTQLDDGPCAGSMQLSSDGFATCLGMSAAAPTMLSGNLGARMTPEPRLSCGTAYQVRLTTAALAADGVRALAAYTSPSGFVTAACFNDYAGVVISQVYASGGLSGAAYDADFVELHNRGAAPVNLAGWSLQLASAAGTTWATHALSAGTIAPGGYFLVSTTSAGDAGTALPAADAALTGADLDASGGRVLLSSSGAAEAGQCPGSAAVIDYVGWGSAVSSCVGGAPASAPGATTALVRAFDGCRDTDADAADFAVQAAVPRSAASAPFACATANESGQAAEADWCTLQFPLSFSITSGSNSPVLYGRVYEAGVTEVAGASALVRAQVGHGPESVNPSTEQAGWTWVDAAYNLQVGNDDEYMASLPTPPLGAFRYAYRFSLDGQPWTYCDTDGSGANGAFRFDPRLLGVMNVTP